MHISALSSRLSSLIIDHGLHPPRPIDDLKKDLASSSHQISAMRTVVSMTQLNYDTSALTADILKLIDTNNYELKALCNFYLRSTCWDRPACQLMCTHTFFKDFNDRNHKIQQLALIDSMYLSDDVLVEHYVRDIKRMAFHPQPEVRMLTARCISILYLKNRALFYKKNFKATLKALLADKTGPVVVAALKALGAIEAVEPIVATDVVVAIGTRFYERGVSNGLRYALNILKHKKMTEGTRKLISKALASNDIAVFYLSARMLLACGFSPQLIYQAATGFMNARPEQLCNLLVFIHSFVDRVDCEVSDFFIGGSCCSDRAGINLYIPQVNARGTTVRTGTTGDIDIAVPTDTTDIAAPTTHHTDIATHQRDITAHRVNVVKIMIMIRKYKSLDHTTQGLVEANLLRSIRSPCLTSEIFETLLRNDVHIPSLVSKVRPSDQIIRCIARNQEHITGGWRRVVSNLLVGVKETRVPRLYVGLVARFCNEIPKHIFRFEDEKYASHLLRMFVAAMRRGVITTSQCRTYLKNVQRRHEMLVKVALVLEHLETVDPEDIVSPEETDSSDTEGCRAPQEDWLAIDFEPRKSADDGLVDGQQAEPADNDQAGNEVEATATRITQLPFFIDFNNLKGLLDVEGSRLVFTVDILEGEATIKYAVGSNPPLRHEDQILQEGRYSLFEVTADFFGREYTVEIENQRFRGALDLPALMKPQSCTFTQFEDGFDKAEGTAVIDTRVFGCLSLHKVDFQRYSGVVLGHKVFLKSGTGGYDVRGDEYITRLLSKGE